MAVRATVDFAGVTRAQYERLNDALDIAAPPPGLLVHTCGPTDEGWRIVDVWESEEAFQRFGEVIGPILQEVGFPGEPRVSPLHNFVK